MSYDVAHVNEYDIVSESQLSSILANINIDLTLSVIDDIINQRTVDYNFNTKTNSPAAFENHFKQLLVDYGFDSDVIKDSRDQTYRAIIDKVCSRHFLKFDESKTSDLYSAAYYIYDFLISNFNNYLVAFFTNFINNQKNSLYDILELNKQKKNKDSSTLYNKKVYKNNKLAVISANLEQVINYICGMDISFLDILNLIYNDRNIVQLLYNCLLPINDFFKLMFVPLFSCPVKPILLTNIRLSIQQLGENTINILDVEQIKQQEEAESSSEGMNDNE